MEEVSKMKLSQSFFYTLRENAKDEDSVSSNLLVRAGMIKKCSNGIYMIMPMGKKVLSLMATLQGKRAPQTNNLLNKYSKGRTHEYFFLLFLRSKKT